MVLGATWAGINRATYSEHVSLKAGSGLACGVSYGGRSVCYKGTWPKQKIITRSNPGAIFSELVFMFL